MYAMKLQHDKRILSKQKQHLLVPIVPISEPCLYFRIFSVYFDVKSRTMLWWWCVSVCIGKSTERLVVAAVKASNFHCKDHCQEIGQRNRRRQRSTITTIIIIIPSYDIKWATYFYSGERKRGSHVFTFSKKEKKVANKEQGREVILLCSSNLLKINTAEILYRVRSFFVTVSFVFYWW